MKFLSIFLMIALTQSYAISNAQRISLSQKNASLETVFTAIEKQSGYTFFYDASQLPQTKISIKLLNASIEDAMRQMLNGLPLTYKIVRNNIVLTKINLPKNTSNIQSNSSPIISSPLLQQQILHGRVTDTAGNPMHGVSVINSRKNNFKSYTLTDTNGAFELEVEKGNNITFSYIGYKNQTITVSDEMEINVTMQVQSNELDSVTINTGYQKFSRERSAGSFSKPNIAQFANANSAGSNIISRLDGLVPGLAINNSPTLPGVHIRGITSINASSMPLYVVDGLPTDNINDLNYNDVQDVTVLKDATAASIWGARAANGVIVITTKKAIGNRLNVDYDVNYSFQGKPDLGYLNLMNSQQFIQAVKEVYTNTFFSQNAPLNNSPGLNAYPPHYQILYDQYLGKISAATANTELDSLASINNTSQIESLWYRSPLQANHTISVAAGGKIYSFRASFSYIDNLDNTPKDRNNTYNLMIRNDFNFGKRVQAYIIAQMNDNETSSDRYGSVRPRTDASVVPYQLYRGNNGQNLDVTWLNFSDSIAKNYQALSGINTSYVPLDEATSGYTKSSTLHAKANGGITIHLIDGLRFEGTYGIEKDNGRTTSFDDPGSWAVRLLQLKATSRPSTPGGAPTYYLPMTGGTFDETNSYVTNWTVRNQFVYDKDWSGKKHQLTLLAGQEAQDNLTNDASTTEYGYDPQLLTYTPIDYYTLSTKVIPNPVMTVNSGININAHNYVPQEIDYRFVSYYANAAYTYDEKYTINGSWRNDQSNLFGEDKSAQRKPVWSAGAAWVMSKEDFMQDISWLDNLMLRATYGITGNSPTPGTAASYDILNATGSTNFTGSSLSISTPANKILTWEETKNIDLGLDFSVLHDRLNGSIDVYQKRTSNLIGILPLNVFTGYANITGNYGDMENKGIELSLNSVNVRTRDFTWSTSLNAGYNKNKITKIATSVPYTQGSQLINTTTTYVVGYPAQTIFAYNYAGLNDQGFPQIKLANGTVTTQRNVAKPADMVNMGTYQPVWSGGLSNVFTYKSFTLSANIVFDGGNVMRRDVNTVYGGNILYNLPREFANRWKQPGDEKKTDIPGYITDPAEATNYDYTYYIFANSNVLNASFAKLRDLSVAYSLPLSLIKKVRATAISLRAGISNIMLWKANHYGIDPEFQQSRDAVYGLNGYNYPVRTIPIGQHMITLGAHITF